MYLGQQLGWRLEINQTGLYQSTVFLCPVKVLPITIETSSQLVLAKVVWY